MSFLTDILFPPRCVSCSELIEAGKRGTPFCEDCLKRWENAKREARKGDSRCPSAVYSRAENGRALYTVRYRVSDRSAVQNRFILYLKDKCDRLCIRFAARELYELIEGEYGVAGLNLTRENSVVVWVPASISSMKNRGFDRMERVASQLAKMLRSDAGCCLKRKRGSTEQKQLSGNDRFENAKRSIVLTGKARVKGKTVILIDDIMTGGSSLSVSAGLLRDAGAERIIAAVLALAD